MAEKTYPMTLAEKEQLEQELEELKLVRRPEVIERIKIARSYGDLSENSEYDAAKDEQAFVEGQIQNIETKIRYAEIIDSDAVAKDEVAIGKTVTVQEVGTTDKALPDASTTPASTKSSTAPTTRRSSNRENS